MSVARRRRHRRAMVLTNRQGPMFPGNRAAATLRDNTLQSVMNSIDSHEVRGVLPRGTIQRVVDENRVVFPWLTRYQIDGLRRRRASHRRELAIHLEEEANLEREEDKDDLAMSIHDHDDIQFIEGYDSFDSDDIDYDPSLNTALVSDSTVFAATIGRKKGSTNNAKLEYKKRKNLLIDEISDTWY